MLSWMSVGSLKNQKVPRLVDLIMRPVLSGRKTIGMLEAHANGLRFRSKKGEVVDIMYNNIRHAVFHPCKGTINVVIHFHLKVRLLACASWAAEGGPTARAVCQVYIPP